MRISKAPIVFCILLIALAAPSAAKIFLYGAAPGGGGGGGAAPTVDGAAVSAAANTTTGTCPTVTTTGTNRTLYIAADNKVTGFGAPPAVLGVTNTFNSGPPSLTWAVLSGSHTALISDDQSATGITQTATIWRARAPSAGNYDITVTWNQDADVGNVICWAVIGDNATNPQDANASLAVTAKGSPSPPIITGLSTTAANSLLVFFNVGGGGGNCASGAETGIPPVGWTKLASIYNPTGGAYFGCAEVDVLSVSAAQSSITITSGNTGDFPNPVYYSWLAIATALVP